MAGRGGSAEPEPVASGGPQVPTGADCAHRAGAAVMAHVERRSGGAAKERAQEASGSSEGRAAGNAANADASSGAPAVEEVGRPSAAHWSGTARIAGPAEWTACCTPGALGHGKTGAVRKEEAEEGALWLDVDAPVDAESPVTLYRTGASLMLMQNERLASSWWRTVDSVGPVGSAGGK